MNDLISRQAAIDALCNDYCGGHQDCKHYPKCENLKSIQKLPSVQPEIIRCKDCKKIAYALIIVTLQTKKVFVHGQKGKKNDSTMVGGIFNHIHSD